MGGSNDAVDACSTLPNIFIQHVSGQGNVIGPYRPIVDFAWNNPTNETMCPTPSVIGCVANQRQPLAAYTASLRKFCSTMKKIHSSDGAPYVASYINIPGLSSHLVLPDGIWLSSNQPPKQASCPPLMSGAEGSGTPSSSCLRGRA